MPTLSSTLLYALLFACGSKKPAVQTVSKPEPAITEPQSTEDSQAQKPIGPVLGFLDKSLIDERIKEHYPKIQACFEEGYAIKPDLNGDVVIKVVIGKDGTVSSAESNPERTNLNSPEVIQCIAEQMAQIEFPAPKGGGIVIIHYPFSFSQ